MKARYTAIAAVATTVAVGFVGTGMASAHEFTARYAPGTLELAGEKQVFVVGPVSERGDIECSKVTGTGSVAAVKAMSQDVTAKYEKCAFGPIRAENFSVEYEVGADGTLKILKEARVKSEKCTIALLESSGLTMTYSNHSGKLEASADIDTGLEWEGESGCSGRGGAEYLGKLTIEEVGGTFEWS